MTAPTIIAMFATQAAQSESDDDASEALADFQYYLDEASKSLKRKGVRLEETNDSVVRWNDRVGRHCLTVTDSSRILYLFVDPTGHVLTDRSGVMQDEGILDLAHKAFGIDFGDDRDSTSRMMPNER